MEKDYPDNSDNVLLFTKRFDDNADIKEKRNFIEDEANRQARRCYHKGVLVNEYERKVTCRYCGSVLDAFDYILSIAKEETKVEFELRALRFEIKSHREGLEKLKREEVNCKSRIRNAQFRLNDVMCELNRLSDELLSKKLNKN
ncbi:hypothetical protein [Yersinia enterocolitica]|uniref:hypothetical protein n=1 Tax=Yersinia enterocolitica TaxID=630 RepID=UPI001C8CFA43|nr:hypothetical protein [Yersinia enterocolitica]MBX9476795.1 hypothetical protein [Yersinia enterocolitica]